MNILLYVLVIILIIIIAIVVSDCKLQERYIEGGTSLPELYKFIKPTDEPKCLIGDGTGVMKPCTELLWKKLAGEYDTKFLNAESNDGWTPLMMAVNKSNPYIVDILLQFGADPNYKVYTPDKDPELRQRTPLNLAIYKYINASPNNRGDQWEVLKTLLKRKPDVNTPNMEDKTSLMMAAEVLDVQLVQLLLNHRAETFKGNNPLQDVLGNTTFYLALQQDDIRAKHILKLLKTSIHNTSLTINAKLLSPEKNVGDQPNVQNEKAKQQIDQLYLALHGDESESDSDESDDSWVEYIEDVQVQPTTKKDDVQPLVQKDDGKTMAQILSVIPIIDTGESDENTSDNEWN